MVFEDKKKMLTDYHSHILPGIDDGSKNVEESLLLLKKSAEQGIHRQIATPHFYWHKESSVADFLQKRQVAYDKIKHQTEVDELYLGAEVALELEVSTCENIDQLAIEGTRLILLEPSYYGFHSMMLQDIDRFQKRYELKPILAHIHRYVQLYSRAQLEQLLSLDVIFQINADAFLDKRSRKLAKRIIEYGKEFVFGTDCHNMQERMPNYNLLMRALKKMDLLERSNGVFEKYCL